MENYEQDRWNGFILVFFFTCFLVICNYGPILNIFIWIMYMLDKPKKSDWDQFHIGLIALFIVINIILIFIFAKFW